MQEKEANKKLSLGDEPVGVVSFLNAMSLPGIINKTEISYNQGIERHDFIHGFSITVNCPRRE